MKVALLFLMVVLSAPAQTSPVGSPSSLETNRAAGQAPTGQSSTNQPMTNPEQVEQVRLLCIESRRQICGKIVKIFPQGLVIDSGYTNLDRSPLNRSWLVPGTAEAERPAHAIEQNEPAAMCIGLVYLTDVPRIRGTKPKLYDYVNLTGYPTGQYTYSSVGTLQRTVRKFSAKLAAAVAWKFSQSQK